MIARRKFLTRNMLRQFTNVQRQPEEVKESPVRTDLNAFCLNPLLKPGLREYKGLEDSIQVLRKKEMALLRHVPHHAPLRQAYYTNTLAKRSTYTSRFEWILAVFFSVSAMIAGPERFNFF